MNFIQIAFNNIKSETERFLKREHNKSSLSYSPASPFGHILSTLQQYQQLSFVYLKNALRAFDLSLPNSNNPKIIRNSAIFAGHIPGRAISSTGTLKLVVKSGIDLETELRGGRVSLNNRLLLKNNTNGLFYSLNLGQDKVTYQVSTTTQIFLPIIQGEMKKTSFTGTGEINSSYQLALKGKKEIENFNVEVLVNGEYWTIKKSPYDLLPEEKSCVVRTGFNDGIDIIFGNGGFGRVPNIGSNIEIRYLLSDGADGNIFRRTPNDWTFVEDAIDGFGGTLDMTSIFDILIFNDINFGSNKENIKFTKNLLPIASNNFVLGLPQQYAYEIKKLGVFSHVNAYENDNVVFVVATPNIRLFKNRNADYFSVNIAAFELDDYEKSKVDKYIRGNGNIQLTRKYRIDSPKLSYYIMNVFIVRYSDAKDDTVNAQITNVVSEHFLDLNRIDRIPKSDLIASLSNINDIHSVDVQFISKKNEDYHRDNKIKSDNKVSASKSRISPIGTEIDPDYKPDLAVGLDPVLGDILFESDEYPIIRGGWYDRNGIFFSPDIQDNNLKSINIIKTGVVDSKLRNK
jgi:hypothetical protein